MALPLGAVILSICLLTSALASTQYCIKENNHNLCCDHLDMDFIRKNDLDCAIQCLTPPVSCKKIIMKSINDDERTLFLQEEHQDNKRTQVCTGKLTNGLWTNTYCNVGAQL